MAVLDSQDLSYAATAWERQLAARGGWTDPFERDPVPLDAWLADDYYVDLGFQPSDLQMAALRHFEWVYFPETWTDLGWDRPDVRLINYLVLKWGKGSGKDTISQVGLLRICYLLQVLRNPQAYYGIGLHSPIHLTNIAVSAPQANAVFYRPLTELIKASPFFKDLAEPGMVKTVFDKKVELISGHSDTASQEGLNLLAGVADEIAEFKTKEEVQKTKATADMREPKNSAEGIDNMIRSSGRSRFPQVHKAAYLSWTRFEGDYICRLYKEGEEAEQKAAQGGSRSRWYISHAATWVANPSKSQDDFADEYERDPENARGKYECQPPKSQDSFFRNKVALGLAFPVRDAGNPVTHELVEGEDPDNPGQFGWQARFAFADDFLPVRGAPYAVHIDLAHTQDRAGFALSHVSRWIHREREDDDDRVLRQPEVTLDLAHAFERGPHGEIELRWCRQLVFRLVERGFKVRRVTLDGYQSVDTIQILNAALGTANPKAPVERKKIAELYSLDRTTEGYDTLKSQVYSRLYKGYRTPTVGEGALAEECIWWTELQALQKIGGAAARAKIDHPPYGSKDVADAIAGSCRGAIHAARVWGIASEEEVWVGGADEGLASGPEGSTDALGGLSDPASLGEDLLGLGGLPQGW